MCAEYIAWWREVERTLTRVHLRCAIKFAAAQAHNCCLRMAKVSASCFTRLRLRMPSPQFLEVSQKHVKRGWIQTL